jgi:hypothetical protein
MTDVKPSCANLRTFFQTFRTEPQVVSTSVQPCRSSRASSWTDTPNAGRITTSSGVRVVARSLASVRMRMPRARSRSLTSGLWMISPVRKTRLSGKRLRV